MMILIFASFSNVPIAAERVGNKFDRSVLAQAEGVNKMEQDITERLEDRANSYEQIGRPDTAAILREAKYEIEQLRAYIQAARKPKE